MRKAFQGEAIGKGLCHCLEEEWGWDVMFPGGCNILVIERSGGWTMCHVEIRDRNWKRGYGKDCPGECNGKKESGECASPLKYVLHSG